MRVLSYREEISHEFARHTLLRDYQAGRVPRASLCDADVILITAAKFHGTPAGRRCPVCREDQLRFVKWVHGEQLGRRTGTARNDAEIARLVAERGELTVHLVEVCPDCGWNHLLKAVTATLEPDNADLDSGPERG